MEAKPRYHVRVQHHNYDLNSLCLCGLEKIRDRQHRAADNDDADDNDKIRSIDEILYNLAPLDLIYCPIRNKGYEYVSQFLKVATCVKKELALHDGEIEPIMDGLVFNKNITALYVRRRIIRFGKPISQMLQISSTLAHLKLGRNHLDDTTIGMIMNSLAYNKSITNLNLIGISFGTEGCELVSRMLTTNNTITDLVLSNNGIDGEGIKIIIDGVAHSKSLTTLKFGESCLKEDGCKSISEMLATTTTLTAIDLGGMDMHDNAGLEWIMCGLERNKSITKLRLNPNEFKNYLARVCLDLEGCKCIIKMLAKNSTLTWLDLGVNEITDEPLSILVNGLVDNTNITALSLYGNAFCSKESQKHLSKLLEKNTVLTYLDLSNTLVADTHCSGLGMIRDGLQDNKTLSHLDLRKHQIDKEGYEQLLNLIQSNFYLKHLDFEGISYPKNWWEDSEEIIRQIVFRLGLNHCGIPQKMRDNYNKIKHADWVDMLTKVLGVDSFVRDWYERNSVCPNSQLYNAGTFSSTYYVIRNMHDKILPV